MASRFLKRMTTASHHRQTHIDDEHTVNTRVLRPVLIFPTLLDQVDEFNLMGIPLKPVQDTVALTCV